MTDDLIATGPDDIDAAVATIRRLVGSPDEHGFQLRVSSRLGVNGTVMVGLGALVRVLIRIHTETGDDDPAEFAASLIASLRHNLGAYLQRSFCRWRSTVTGENLGAGLAVLGIAWCMRARYRD